MRPAEVSRGQEGGGLESAEGARNVRGNIRAYQTPPFEESSGFLWVHAGVPGALILESHGRHPEGGSMSILSESLKLQTSAVIETDSSIRQLPALRMSD